ncbi:MAG TPA: archaetidylserine decarboxylase [Steroidobacteraceae bacterium]|nr:archaetidylserine decarboxylase [Steroidobacteraceae bacterium]
MTLRAAIARIAQHEDLNFLLTNRLPRRWLTLFLGWLSRREHPLVRGACIGAWRLFSPLDLSDARSTRFRSLQDCFTRELRPGARPIDPHPSVLVSPCDAIVGAMGPVRDGSALQVKGFPYALADLLGEHDLIDTYRRGSYVTLRLTAAMYHRFHAPYDLQVEQVTYVSGDTWNVNPIALKRIERLFCKNERAIIRCRLIPSGHLITLVPVAAILVASIRLHFADVLLHLRYRGPNRIPCDAVLRKGEEMGWFQHGSTIIAFAPPGVELRPELAQGDLIRVGQPLLRLREGGA